MNSESSLRKRRGLSPYGFEDLRQLRVLLADLRQDLSRSFEELEGTVRRAIGESLGDLSRVPHHLGDRAADVSEHDMAMAFLARAEGEMEEIDDALERIDNYSYGLCEECEQPIPLSRLFAAPATRFCVDCQRANER
jgi:RNA polymerase-binding protein DksA